MRHSYFLKSTGDMGTPHQGPLPQQGWWDVIGEGMWAGWSGYPMFIQQCGQTTVNVNNCIYQFLFIKYRFVLATNQQITQII